jgi:hypothetical protein
MTEKLKIFVKSINRYDVSDNDASEFYIVLRFGGEEKNSSTMTEGNHNEINEGFNLCLNVLNLNFRI